MLRCLEPRRSNATWARSITAIAGSPAYCVDRLRELRELGLDKIVVKGRTQPAEIFEVLGFLSELPVETQDCIDRYLGGITKYLARDWDGARAAFEKSAALEPHQPGSF